MKLKAISGLLVFELLFSLSVLAQQKRTMEEYSVAFAQLDSLLVTFQRAGQFREPGQARNSRKVMDEYQQLFMPDVYVWDNYCPKRDPDNFNKPLKPYTGAYKLIGDFINTAFNHCDKGVRSNLAEINADFSGIDRNEVRYVIRREANIESYDGSRFKSTELFQLLIKLDPGSGKFRIFEMKDLSHSLDCSNCDFKIAVPVHPSEDPKIRAKAWATLEGGFGIGQFNVQDISLDQLDPSTYDQLSSSRSRVGAKRDSEVRSAFFGRASAEMLFGHINQYGIALGLSYSGCKARATYDSVTVSFRSVDRYGTSYNRIIRLSDMQEDYSVTTLAVPVLLRYTRRINERLRFHLAVGPQAIISAKSKTSASATADAEARYQYDPETGQFGYVRDGNDNGLALVWTEDATETDYDDPSREWRRRATNGYDVGNDQQVEGSTNHAFKFSVGWTASLSGSFKINTGNEIIAGVELWYATLRKDAENISFMNQSSDPLGSRLSGMKEVSFLNYYVKVGIRTFLWGRKKSGE